MRARGVLIAFFVLIAQPLVAAEKTHALEQMKVAELRQRIQAGRFSDGALASLLERVQLTERLTRADRDELRTHLAGEKSRQAFTVLADLAELLPPPASAMSPDPAPDPEEQKAIVARAVDFAANMVTILPRFYATRTTARYERVKPQRIVREAPPVSAFIDLSDNSLHVSQAKPAPEPAPKPLRLVDHRQAMVLYRGEQEVVDEYDEPTPKSNSKVAGAKKEKPKGMQSWGEFGPFLRLILTDVLKSSISFSHWDQGESDKLAVFHFHVPRETSHYIVQYCCVSLMTNLMVRPVQDTPEYEGEISIDSAIGAVMRLAVHTEPQSIPIERADVVLEYGFVPLGGKLYLCPKHSITVSISHAATALPGGQANEPGKDNKGRIILFEPERTTAINDVIFDDYHMAVGEGRMMPAKPEPSPEKPDSPPQKPRPQPEAAPQQ